MRGQPFAAPPRSELMTTQPLGFGFGIFPFEDDFGRLSFNL
jgi:hypothetical protein